MLPKIHWTGSIKEAISAANMATLARVDPNFLQYWHDTFHFLLYMTSLSLLIFDGTLTEYFFYDKNLQNKLEHNQTYINLVMRYLTKFFTHPLWQ